MEYDAHLFATGNGLGLKNHELVFFLLLFMERHDDSFGFDKKLLPFICGLF